MPARRPPAASRRKFSEDEVLQRWSSLSLEHRTAVMRFDDALLVGRIRTVLQALFEKQNMMLQLCAGLGCEDAGVSDPFEASVLLKQAFEFTCDIARMANNPSVMMMSPTASPIMVMKVGFLQEAQLLFDTMKNALPDFLSQQASRTPLPKARWKELWGVEPASVAAVEQQLAKLAEQALWAMVSEQSLPTSKCEECPEISDLSLEPWMTEHDLEVVRAREAASKANKKKKKRPSLKRQDENAAGMEPQYDIEAETAIEITHATSGSASVVASTRMPASRDSTAYGTPWHRGQWILTKQQAPGSNGKARAFVHNTFIDIDLGNDAAARAFRRSSRSLSPSFTPKPRQPDQWQWFWQ